VIRVARPPQPKDLKIYTAKPGAPGAMTPSQLESDAATTFFTNAKNFAGETKLTKASFSFRIYKDTALAAVLEAVFANKCAYCESNFAHVTPKDIEHFRPKSEIDIGTGILAPGYYWLAADWENLLVSCPDCNRSRLHEVPGQAKKVRLGKASQFPLVSERGRVRNVQGGLTGEDRLLIDPCRDEPEAHLRFEDDGLIRPRADRSGRVSRKGETSITAYALNRKYLVEERKRVLDELRFKVVQLHETVRDIAGFTASGDDPRVAEKHDQLRVIRDAIDRMFVRSAPYQAMLRGWLRSQDELGELVDLKRLGVNLLDAVPTT
jgi:uncharacterized protein (TIGR02646 family)